MRGLRLPEARRRMHYAQAPVVRLEGTEHAALAFRGRDVDTEAAGEALLGAESIRLDLVAERAGHAVGGQRGFFTPGVSREGLENESGPPSRNGVRARH